ncbi:rhomboid family intramembrane serine protease [Rhodoluna sp.]|uniref:rhomboid family intramembrane serine protease n=1 Tax=Rhodoluna sp. TaxID=1969481 RepID=UPI0025DDD409|nr:rhomboid family intramembrane serine protease [Rhodoluna sp.]
MNFITQSRAKVTLALVAINVLLWVGQILPGSHLTEQLFFAPALATSEPWRFITAGFVHSPSNPLHVLLNMYSIYIFGQILEPMLGRVRYLALYLVSVLGGSVAVLYLGDPYTPVVGASGAFFGLMAAYFVVLRSVGAGSRGMVGLIAINLFFGFIVPGISWQGHVGGLLAGGAVASLYAATRNEQQKTAQKLGLLAIVAVFVALAIYKANNLSL